MRKYMALALEEAQKAKEENEVPIGAVIVKGEEVVARAHNSCAAEALPTKHAEIKAIEQALRFLGRRELFGCTLYVTLEPCPMCAGAVVNSRLSKVVFGAYDSEFGALGSFINLASHRYAKGLEVYGGICERECTELLAEFFAAVREEKR